MTQREKEILSIIRQDPFIQQQEIADRLNIARSSVAGHIMSLTQKGYIQGKGYIVSAQSDYVVVIGSCNMDVTGYLNESIVYEDSNPGKIETSPGGVGRNIAENIALLGDECHLVSLVGNDFYGNQLLEHIRKVGVDVDHCHTLKGSSTSTYVSFLEPNGEMVVALNDMDIMEQLTPTLLSESKFLIQNAKIIVVDCNLTEDAISWIFNNRGDVPIFVDTVSAFKAYKIKKWLPYIHTIKPNRLEAEKLSGITIDSQPSLLKAIDWFHQQGVKRVAISLGTEGVYYSEVGGEKGVSPPVPTKVVNVTGAGDAMVGGMVHCFLNDKSFSQSIRFGQACSALTLASEFTNFPNLSVEYVNTLLESQHDK